jgi:hypothetical protein
MASANKFYLSDNSAMSKRPKTNVKFDYKEQKQASF